MHHLFAVPNVSVSAHPQRLVIVAFRRRIQILLLT